MKNFTTVEDVPNPPSLIRNVEKLIQSSTQSNMGDGKTLGLLFFNPSLRTRLSTQKAAQNLGMDVIVLNINSESWNVEFEDGTVMDGTTQEHIKDTIKVVSSYCDILGVRTFADLENAENDYREKVLSNFLTYSGIPVISLESATLHPLQSLTDMATISNLNIRTPKVVLTWAPHPSALPQAVSNSFLEWLPHINADPVITHLEGYELSEQFTDGIEITHNQDEAFSAADVIYTKNWSSFRHCGQTPALEQSWTVTKEKMNLTNNASFMHCLPIRRNVVATDAVIDQSAVYRQAKNREFAAQAVLYKLLEEL